MNFPLISNITNAKANNNDLPNNFNEIYHLEYFLRFSPYKNEYSTTKYALDLEKYNESGASYVKISLYYEDLDLTLFNDNYSYVISLSSREIQETSNINYNQYISGTHTEIFLNLPNFENSNIIRTDEAMTFSNYFGRYIDPNSIRSDTTFNYLGLEEYNLNLLYNLTTYHYNSRLVLWSEGDL